MWRWSLEPNFVTIETTVSEMINLTVGDEEAKLAFSKFRDRWLESPVGVELYQRTMQSIKMSEHPNSVLFNALAMVLMAGWRAGVGSAEGKMLEELFQ